MNTNPQRDVSSPCPRAEAAGLPFLSPAAAIPYSLARFFETLGMADDIPWRPTHDQDEPPF
jgi:hypothetical protein